MPKSINPTRPSLNAKRLPAWTSAWNVSHASTDENQTFNAFTNTSSALNFTLGFNGFIATLPFFFNSFSTSSKFVNGDPYKRSMTKTLFELSFSYINGAVANDSNFDDSINRVKSRTFFASFLKSVSSIMLDLKSLTMSTKLARFNSGFKNVRTFDATNAKLKSAFNTSSTPGFKTFTTTSLFDPFNTAAWTCATLAVANGFGSIE